MTYRCTAAALVASYLFALFLVWLAGWLAWPVENLTALSLWWCIATIAGAFVALGLSFRPSLESITSLAIQLCQVSGLIGAVVGIMIMTSDSGADVAKLEGAFTAWSTTATGLSMCGILMLHRWLLGMDRCDAPSL